MDSVTKGVIIAAGAGTRCLPATKAVPKEMLPVLDTPVVHAIAEEMAQSGIKEIILVIHPKKTAIRDHFSRDRTLEAFLKKQGKLDRLASLMQLRRRVRFRFVHQTKPLGNGHALLCAKKALGNAPFAFSDGDSIIDAPIPVIKQLLQVFRKYKAPVLGVQRLRNRRDMVKYGNVYGEPAEKQAGVYRVSAIKEKPQYRDVSPHGLIIGGMRYIFTNRIWTALAAQKKGRSGEIWLSDAVHALSQETAVYAYEYDGVYCDTGSPEALLKTNIHFAKKDPALRTQMRSWLNAPG